MGLPVLVSVSRIPFKSRAKRKFIWEPLHTVYITPIYVTGKGYAGLGDAGECCSTSLGRRTEGAAREPWVFGDSARRANSGAAPITFCSYYAALGAGGAGSGSVLVSREVWRKNRSAQSRGRRLSAAFLVKTP